MWLKIIKTKMGEVVSMQLLGVFGTLLIAARGPSPAAETAHLLSGWALAFLFANAFLIMPSFVMRDDAPARQEYMSISVTIMSYVTSLSLPVMMILHTLIGILPSSEEVSFIFILSIITMSFMLGLAYLGMMLMIGYLKLRIWLMSR